MNNCHRVLFRGLFTGGCPSLKVDFVAVLDSSSSVGRENWEIMKTFVRAVLE